MIIILALYVTYVTIILVINQPIKEDTMTTIQTLNNEIHELQRQQAQLSSDAGVIYPRNAQRYNVLMEQINQLIASVEYLSKIGIK